jgi:Na+-translocating ferredoxin:NAD+ oxidoreductase RnfD subunit
VNLCENEPHSQDQTKVMDLALDECAAMILYTSNIVDEVFFFGWFFLFLLVAFISGPVEKVIKRLASDSTSSIN